jgi:hypothetical protein
MRVIVVTKDQTDYSRSVDEYLHDFKRQTGRDLEVVNPDTPDGVSFCRTYDIVEYPTLVAIDADSRMQQLWRGLPLPTISEVSYYA